uniref:RING-type domain-containing protein n=1 Tax=viral metagenome TaxID=1070528 RepID=A0A6C0KGA0_9ZZZZ
MPWRRKLFEVSIFDTGLKTSPMREPVVTPLDQAEPCPICLARVPDTFMRPCAHGLCQQCATRMIAYYGWPVVCPLCTRTAVQLVTRTDHAIVLRNARQDPPARVPLWFSATLLFALGFWLGKFLHFPLAE